MRNRKIESKANKLLLSLKDTKGIKSIDIIAYDNVTNNQVLDITISNLTELESNEDYNNFLNNYNVLGLLTRYDYKYCIELEAC